MLKLHIGNKNYSSWSMRPWVLMTQAGIPFDEVVLRFDSFDPDSQFKRSAEALSPSGTVPVLVDGELVVWDSLAIAEYLAERHPGVWPADPVARAFARSAAAEMHSGFSALRNICGMNIGVRVALREQPDVVLCGHIHESRAVDRIGPSQVANPGPVSAGHYALVEVGETVAVRLD